MSASTMSHSFSPARSMHELHAADRPSSSFQPAPGRRSIMRPLVLIVLLTGSALGAQQPTRLADHAGTGPAFFTRSSGGRKRIDARGAAVLERRVAMHLAPGTVGEALDTLAAQAGLHIAYSPRVVDLTAHVSL